MQLKDYDVKIFPARIGFGSNVFRLNFCGFGSGACRSLGRLTGRVDFSSKQSIFHKKVMEKASRGLRAWDILHIFVIQDSNNDLSMTQDP